MEEGGGRGGTVEEGRGCGGAVERAAEGWQRQRAAAAAVAAAAASNPSCRSGRAGPFFGGGRLVSRSLGREQIEAFFHLLVAKVGKYAPTSRGL